jgi:hypothetical protein
MEPQVESCGAQRGNHRVERRVRSMPSKASMLSASCPVCTEHNLRCRVFDCLQGFFEVFFRQVIAVADEFLESLISTPAMLIGTG